MCRETAGVEPAWASKKWFRGFPARAVLDQPADPFRRMAERRAQVDGAVVAHAWVELSGRTHTQPIAAGAEVAAERGNEAEQAAGLSDAQIARRASGVLSHGRKGPALGEVVDQAVEPQEPVGAVCSGLAQRHFLDQAEVHVRGRGRSG